MKSKTGALCAVAALLSSGALARDITGISVVSTASGTSALVTMSAGSEGDSHALYFVWDEAGVDRGASLAAWSNVLRVGRVGDGDTSFTFKNSMQIPGGSVCRAFLASSSVDYDYLVSSIQTTGSQYLNTGVCASPTTAVAMDFKMVDTSVQQRVAGASAAGGSALKTLSFDMYINGAGCWASACQNGGGDWTSTGITATKGRTQLCLDAAAGTNTVIIDGDFKIAKSFASNARTYTSQVPICLFVRNIINTLTSSSPDMNTCARLYLYSCSITNAGECVRNYIPAVKGGVAGLYDTVAETFHASDAGNFTESGTNVTFRVVDGDTQEAASPAAVASASAADFTWNTATKDGLFSNPLNWNTGADGVPGLGDTVVITQGTYKIRLEESRGIASIYAWGESKSMPYIYPTIDLGGNTLSVVGAFKANATQDRDAGPRLSVTNGTFNAAAMYIGRQTGSGSSDDSSFGVACGSFHAADANVSVSGTVSLWGPWTELLVSDGSAMTCNFLQSQSIPPNSDNTTQYAAARVRGAGSRLVVKNGLKMWSSSSVEVSDGGYMEVGGYGESNSGMGGAYNIIGRNNGSKSGNYGHVTVDGGTLVLKDYPFAVGFQTTPASAGSFSDRSGSYVTLTNGATLSCVSVPTFYLGCAVSYQQSSADADMACVTNCVLTVAGGSTFNGSGTDLAVGGRFRTSYAQVYVIDGVVNAKTIKLGYYTASTGCASNCVLGVAGRSSRISVAGTGADAFYVSMGSTVRFSLPSDGFAATPVSVAGAVNVTDDDVSRGGIVGANVLEIEAEAFGKRNNGGSAVLIECGTASAASLQRLADNVTFVNTAERFRGTVSVSANGKSLVYTAPVQPGMMILVQ